jgi:4-hydroxythreonine-4-phosphate dehydrogenase
VSIARIAFTPGEPAGIGPDLAVLVAQQNLNCELITFADPALLRDRAKLLGLPLSIRETTLKSAPQKHQPGQLSAIPTPLGFKCSAGTINADSAAYLLETIKAATQACLQGYCSAFVTGPVNKASINQGGFNFSGHTEYIAELSGGHPVMMLATDTLRVALATTHLPLGKVSAAITQETIEKVLRILNHDLTERFNIKNPRLLVSGLNPHAGEGGHLGREEIEVIIPVIQKLQKEGLNITGPLPADTLFTPQHLDHADAVLAMYHDQGLPVLKYSGFGKAVNITLGLPLIRTSVDHGTALDLAGTGKINCGSLEAAIHQAIKLSRN